MHLGGKDAARTTKSKNVILCPGIMMLLEKRPPDGVKWRVSSFWAQAFQHVGGHGRRRGPRRSSGDGGGAPRGRVVHVLRAHVVAPPEPLHCLTICASCVLQRASLTDRG